MAHPVLQYLVNATNSQPYYVPYVFHGEICLTASANQHFLRQDLKPTDDKPLGMKVDGLFCSSRNEIGMVKLSGGYLTFDMPRYLKDHIKGFCGCHDLLNDIFLKNRLGLDVQVWGMDLPASKVYRMFLIGTFQFPINWDEHYKLVPALKILWNLGQFSALENIISNVEDSPPKPIGKESQIINPMFHDRNYNH
nr:837_t:CDS:2 [Entrophospora candida]